ncbi:SigE family RNA polymerase sigma factor [Nocardioides speluncae]|uniref:SigE family RNA polymerase sigma factor n=1 Tax=Nocardioides speluncae TaxID=2670337 RepID=UPI000D685ED7|nr:SigE family RNA polymerase sigma factor [Nocardioides speluncae]
MTRSYDADFAAFATAAIPGLSKSAYLICGDWHRAEDAVQEALIKVYRAWPRVERRESLLAYTRRATVRVLIDGSRRPWRRETSTDDLPVRLVADETGGIDDRDEIVRALATLTPRRRACIVLRYFADLSIAETAETLRCAEGTVKRQTSDALRALRDQLDIELTETR